MFLWSLVSKRLAYTALNDAYIYISEAFSQPTKNILHSSFPRYSFPEDCVWHIDSKADLSSLFDVVIMQASKRLLIYLLVAFECFCGRWSQRDLPTQH